MEKRSDISRDSFRPEQGYTSVRLQQGRPQLDADWNEQMELQLQRERTALYDILGSAASGSAELQPSPRSYQGFQVEMDLGPTGPLSMSIRGGRVYVEGHLVEAEGRFDFTQQPYCPNLKLPEFGSPSASPPASLWIVYLETFEREVTALDDPALREVALGIPDTTTRTQQAWQVRFREIPAAHPLHAPLSAELLRLPDQEQPTLLNLQTLQEHPALMPLSPGVFTPTSDDNGPRPTQPGQLQAQFVDQGATLENRLYRVEITDVSDSAVSIRWSRDNGAIVAPLLRLAFQAGGGQAVVLSRPAVGDASVFAKGQWLEITTPGAELRGEPPLYRRIRSQGVLEAGELTVPIEGSIAVDSFPTNDGGVRVRLWNSASDQTTYPLSLPLKDTDEGPRASDFVPLEDGLQVQLVLQPQIDDFRGQIKFRFAPGQYWQIPMRAVLGGIDWPLNTPRPAQESRHSYLVLGAALTVAPNRQQPQDRLWRYINLLPSPISSLPVLERRIQQTARDLLNLSNGLEQTQPRSYKVQQDLAPINRFTPSAERMEVRYRLNIPIPTGFRVHLIVQNLTCQALINPSAITNIPSTFVIDDACVIVISATLPPGNTILRVNLTALAVFAKISETSDLISGITNQGNPAGRL